LFLVKFGFQVFGGNGAFHSDLLRETLNFDARIGLPDSRSKSLRKFRSPISPTGALETRFGNRRHSVARAETTGNGLTSRRAFDLQQRCRLR